MPCKKKQQLPTKCTPTSRRMLESLTLKDLAEAVAEYLPNSQSSHPIPKSGQYANDRNDCSPGVSCIKCKSHHQEGSETPQINKSESCVSTCREVSAMYDEIRQCRHTIGALAKEAQQLITTASGMLDGCGCNKPGQTKQVKIGSYSEVKRPGSINSYGQRMFREKSRETLIPCGSCEDAAKRRQNLLQQGYNAVGKQSNLNVYAKRRYREKNKEETFPFDAKVRQHTRTNPIKAKQTDIRNCCQKICGENCACDEAETKQQSEVTTKYVGEDRKKKNGNADSRTSKQKTIENKSSDGSTCCDCAARKDVDNYPSDKGMKKQNELLKKPNSRMSHLDKIGKRTNGKDKRVCAERNKCCQKICGEKSKEKEEESRRWSAADSQIEVDDCACVRIMKKRKKKLSRLERIWQIISERSNKCDCGPKKGDECGCYDEDGFLQKIKNKSSCKIIKNKVCGKNITCKCPPTSVDECECYDNMENEDSFLKRTISNNCSLEKISKKVCGKNVTCHCPSKSVDDCECDEDMENQNSFFKRTINYNCSLEKIRKQVWDKETSCDCGPKSVDDCSCDEDMEDQNKYLKMIDCKNSVLKKTWNKVCGKVSCECVANSENGTQEKIEKSTTRASNKNTSRVNVAPRLVPSFGFNGAEKKNKSGIKDKSDSGAESSDIPSSAVKTCKCCFPPAFTPYFECTGQIGGNCHCDTND